MSEFLELTEDLKTAVDQLNQVLQGDENTSVMIDGEEKPSIQKKIFDIVQLLINGGIDFYSSISEGLSNTSDGELFWTMGFLTDPRVTLWENDAGTAVVQQTYLDKRDLYHSKVLIATHTVPNEKSVPIFELDFINNELTINQCRVQVYNEAINLFETPEVLTIESSAWPQALILDISDNSVSILSDYRDLNLSRYEYVLLIFDGATGHVGINGDYTINGFRDNISTGVNIHLTTANEPLANFNFTNNQIEHRTIRVVINGTVKILDPQIISLNTDRNTGFDHAVVLNLTDNTLDYKQLSEMDNEDYRKFIVLYTYNESKNIVYTEYNYLINGRDGHSLGTSSGGTIPYTLSLYTQKHIANFNFNNDEIDHEAMRVVIGSKTTLVQPQTIQLDPNRSKAQTHAIVLDKDDLTLSVANSTTLSYGSGRYEILYFYNEALHRAYTEYDYTVNGSDVNNSSSLTAFTLSVNTDLFLANFDFINNVIEHSQFRVVRSGESVLIPAQNVDLQTNRIGTRTYAVLLDSRDDTLHVKSIHDIDTRLFEILYFYNEALATVYTDFRYKINGVEKADLRDLSDNIVFNDTAAVSTVHVSDSHTQSDPLPIYGAFTSNTLMPDTVYEWYDQLVTDFPDYVSRQLLGYDQSGALPIYGYKFQPSLPNAIDTSTTPRVMLTAVHAETLNYVYTHVLMREICRNWTANDRLSALRTGVEFYVIPCGNPWSMINKTRVNSRGVDINRNFPANWELREEGSYYSGTTPASEVETQILLDVMGSFAPHVGIDCHAFQGGMYGSIG
ncbi:M14 family zinc carboxypeptidase [Pseudoalteromonas sp. SaAl2]